MICSFTSRTIAGSKTRSIDAEAAALFAGRTRFRPVVMTATAMILGMFPMALGLGDAGQQNAPLGSAVIGGLLVSTFGDAHHHSERVCRLPEEGAGDGTP